VPSLEALGKAGKYGFANGHFAECHLLATLQSDQNRPIFLYFTTTNTTLKKLFFAECLKVGHSAKTNTTTFIFLKKLYFLFLVFYIKNIYSLSRVISRGTRQRYFYIFLSSVFLRYSAKKFFASKLFILTLHFILKCMLKFGIILDIFSIYI